jgi:hypothetical protein
MMKTQFQGKDPATITRKGQAATATERAVLQRYVGSVITRQLQKSAVQG